MPIYARAAAPEKIQLVIKGPPGLDLTQVVSVSAEVLKPGGQRATWTFGIEAMSTSAQRIVLTRVFGADGRDLPIHGTLRMGLHFVFPGNVVRRSKPLSEPVLEWLGA